MIHKHFVLTFYADTLQITTYRTYVNFQAQNWYQKYNVLFTQSYDTFVIAIFANILPVLYKL